MRRPRLLAIASILVLPACHRHAQSVPPAPAIHGALAADMPASKRVGNEILAKGGSAVDAAIAALFAQSVEDPASSGIGGGGFAVVWDAPHRQAWTVDFRETAPAGARIEHYLDASGKVDPSRSLVGCWSVGVPGMVAGMAALHRRFGLLPWHDVVEPARKLAADGVPVTPFLAAASRREVDKLRASPTLSIYLRPDGSPLQAGDMLVDADQAQTLEAIENAGDSPESAFYRGPVAQAIEDACADVEGAVRRSDLASYRVVWRTPIVVPWRNGGNDYRLIAMGPPSSGGAIVGEALRLLEPTGFDRRGPEGARSWYLLAESMKYAFADRATMFGDPDFAPVPVERLLSPQVADERRDAIDSDRTRPKDDYTLDGLAKAMKDDAGTTNVSAIDAEGSAVAITNSVNMTLGSLVRTARGGVLLDDTMDDFTIGSGPNGFGLVGNDRNAIAPGKRPVSSMSPVVVLENGRVRLAAGGSGGPLIASSTLQVVLGVTAEGRPLQEAVDLPRIHEQWVPDRVDYEPGLPDDVVGALGERGYAMNARPFLGVDDSVELPAGSDAAVAALDGRKMAIAAAETPIPSAAPVATPAPAKKKTR